MYMSKRRVGGLIFAAVLIVFLYILLANASSDLKADSEGTRAQGDGASCHDDKISDWVGTAHASAWDTLNVSGDKKDWCEVCHTTGANDTLHNGFDPATDQPEYLKNVSCESCHGPDPMSLSDPSTSVDLDAAVCGTCHKTVQLQTYHPYYDEWLDSRHSESLSADGGSVVTDPTCQGCHVAQIAIAETIEGGTAVRPVVDPQPITCAVCHDPHGSLYPNQLRMPREDLCATCHNPGQTPPGEEIRHPQSYIRSGISSIDSSLVPSKDFMKDVTCDECHLYSTGPPQNITGHSFTFRAEACADCHTGNPSTFPLTTDQASKSVAAYQTGTSDLLTKIVLPNVTIAQTMIDEALDNGYSLSTINNAQDMLDEANEAVSFVDADKSYGAHNPQYASALLNFAAQRAWDVIDMLDPGHVIGRIVDSDGEPVAGVIIRRSGSDIAFSNSEGVFSFDYASGTYDFDLVKDGDHVGRISGVQIVGGNTTDTLDNEITVPSTFDWTLPLIVIIAILVVAVLILVWRTTGKGGEEEEEEEAEDEKGRTGPSAEGEKEPPGS
jgi:predicted CXXCH cytochrome family protein